jgi:hypothetical protein
MAIAAIIAMIATTIMSSINVKPCSLFICLFPIFNSFSTRSFYGSNQAPRPEPILKYLSP